MGVGLSRWISSLLVILLAVLAGLVVFSEAGASPGGMDMSAWIPVGDDGSNSLVGDSISDEFAFDTEISRRILQSRTYISYGALSRDRVPCSLRGASYYNCRPGAQANPYSRGCSAITRCRTN